MTHAADDSPSRSLSLADEDATLALGAALARKLVPGLHADLEGDLGSGKTTLVRGVLRALGHAGPVRSPTFTIVELYAISRLELYHFDFYRFEDPHEFLDAGLEEAFGRDAICIVEWPGKARPYLPPADLRIELSVRGTGRVACLVPVSDRGLRCLDGMVRTTEWRHIEEASQGGTS